jgi:DNA polymerase-1
VPIKIDFKELELKEADDEALLEIFKELEFKSMLKDLTPKSELKSDYRMIEDEKDLDKLVKELQGLKEFAFDFETTSEDPMQAKLAGISFSWKIGKCYYIGLAGEAEAAAADRERKLPTEMALKRLKGIFEDGAIKKIGQNIKYEYIVLANYGIKLRGIIFDTMVASYLLNPSKLNHNLEDIAFEYLNHKMTTSIEDLLGKGKAAVTMDRVAIDKVFRYCCEDSDVTLRLKAVLRKRSRIRTWRSYSTRWRYRSSRCSRRWR